MFRITIEKLEEKNDPKDYDKWKEVYQQQVNELDIAEVVKLVNSIPSQAPALFDPKALYQKAKY